MNYVQIIGDFFERGTQPTEFEPTFLAKMEKDRQSLNEQGLILYIKPQSDVVEEIKDVKDGVRTYTYTGSFIHAFKKDGQLLPTPDGKPFQNESDAIEKGKMVFLVDPEGKLITWFNSLTGNMIGSPTKVGIESPNRMLLIIGILMLLFILWKFFGGYLF